MGDLARGRRAAGTGDRTGPTAVAARAMAAFLLAGSALVLVTVGAADADDVTGGCTGTVNGTAASKVTKSDPAVAHDGRVVSVAGHIPTELVNQNPNSFTTIKLDLLGDTVGVSSEERKSTGAEYQSEADFDKYLKYGAGLYRVEVTNTGPGWTCAYTAYVKVDRSPLGTPIGIAAAVSLVIGAIGVVLAKGRPRTPRRDWFDRLLSDDQRAARDSTLHAAHQAEPDLQMAEEVRYAPVGPPWILTALTLPLAVMPVVGTAGGGVAVPTVTGRRVVWQQYAWKRGHAVVGFLAGGLLGAGIGVLGWQYALWLLDIWSAFVVPVAVAFAGGVYAWSGRRYVGRVIAPTQTGATAMAGAADVPVDDDDDDAEDDEDDPATTGAD